MKASRRHLFVALAALLALLALSALFSQRVPEGPVGVAAAPAPAVPRSPAELREPAELLPIPEPAPAESEAEPAYAPGDVRGTCKLEGSSTPIAGVEVELWRSTEEPPSEAPSSVTGDSTSSASEGSESGDSTATEPSPASPSPPLAPVASARSDASGRFSIPLAASVSRERLTIRARAPRGLVPVRGTGPLSKSRANGRTAVDIVFGKGLAGPVGGVVLDERTKEPVPECWLSVASDAGCEWILTGADGRFVGSDAHPESTILIKIWDAVLGGRVLLAAESVEHERSKFGALSFQVPIGPTYLVRNPTSAVTPPEVWQARLIESASPPGLAGTLRYGSGRRSPRLDFPPLVLDPPGGVPDNRVWNSTGLRGNAGSGFWVRFPRVEFEPIEQFTPHLELECAVQRGSAPVHGTIGISPDEVSIALRGNAEIRGSLILDSEEDTKVEVLLLPPFSEAGHAKTPDWKRATRTEASRFEFKRLEPGYYNLLVRASGHLAAKREVLAGVGLNTLAPIPLEPVAALGHFGGIVVEADAQTVDDLLLAVRPTDAGPYAAARVLAGIGSGAGSGSFKLDGLPFSAHAFECYSLGSSRWRGPQDSLFPPKRAITIEAHRTEALGQFIALERGRFPIRGASAHLGPPGLVITDLRIEDSAVAMGPALDWGLFAPRYEPAYGDETAFQATSEQNVHFTAIELRDGWGFQLYLREGSGHAPYDATDEAGRARIAVLSEPPVPGVTAKADGATAGVSDANGRLRISGRRRPPSQVTLHRDGWRVTGITHVSPEQLTPVYVVFLQRLSEEPEELGKLSAEPVPEKDSGPRRPPNPK